LLTLKVVSAPRVIKSCLPISTTSMSFVGSESRSTMFPASFAAWVPEFIATPTSARASAGASLVPSPVMATSRPPSCVLWMYASFASGVASARKSSTPASFAMAAAVRGLSPGDHHGANPHGAQPLEALAHAGLHRVFEVHHAEHPRPVAHHQRGSAGLTHRCDVRPSSGGSAADGSSARTCARTASPAPLRSTLAPASRPLMRVAR
jgi:hypothetical protein